MEKIESKILSILTELKENHGVVALKAEFEAEGASFDEVILLKQYASEVGLNLTLKIGGCEAVRDIIDAKKIGVDSIVAPMIETPYALKKFISAVTSVYDDVQLPRLFINIETITGVENFDSIQESELFDKIDGVVIGRTDLLGSLGLSQDDSDINLLLDISDNISKKIQQLGKKIIIGGNISANSYDFLNDLEFVSNFETRKVVFNSDVISTSKFSKSVNNAIEFEMLWLENKIQTLNSYGFEAKRFEILKKRYENSLEVI